MSRVDDSPSMRCLLTAGWPSSITLKVWHIQVFMHRPMGAFMPPVAVDSSIRLQIWHIQVFMHWPTVASMPGVANLFTVGCLKSG